MDKQTLIGALENRAVKIKFVKKGNEEVRLMTATLAKDLLPTLDLEKVQEKNNKDNTLVTLYDLDLNDWRSLHSETVLEIV